MRRRSECFLRKVVGDKRVFKQRKRLIADSAGAKVERQTKEGRMQEQHEERRRGLLSDPLNQRGISGTAIFYTVEKAAAHSCLSLCLPRSVFVADGLCPSFPATGG